MKASYLDILIIAIFLITLIIAYFKAFNRKDILADFIFGSKIILAIISYEIVNYIMQHSESADKIISVFISQINKYIISPAFTAYIITILLYGISIYIVYFILKIILNIFNRFYIKNKLIKIESNKSFKGEKRAGISGVIFSFTTAIAYAAIIGILFAILSIQNILPIKGNSIFVSSITSEYSGTGGDGSLNPFYYIKNQIDNQTIASASNESKSTDEQASNVVVYYNGVTLDQAVKSDSDINNMAKKITRNDTTDIEKARSIYNWVGSNVEYDDNKAEEITKDDGRGMQSGAIEAFNTRQGVCFDYASLYVAMARAVGLQVRIISGEGYTGTQWGPHAWNEVYIPSQNKWIPVDPTFESSGDYFATLNFYDTHKDGKIIGQW